MEFKPGDKVQLLSGSPAMTVSEVSKISAQCQWFDGKKLYEGTFPFTSLKPAQDGPGMA